MPEPNPADKRKLERYVLILPVKYSLLVSGEEGAAQMQDISDEGIKLTLEKPLPVGTKLDIWLYLPDASCFYTKAEVMWLKGPQDGKYAAGVKLTEGELIKAIGLVKKAIESSRKFYR